MIQTEDVNEVTVVHFAVRNLLDVGEVNSIFDFVSKIVQDRGRRKIVLNLGKLEYLSSLMLGKLLRAMQEVEAVGGRMVLCHVSPHFRQIFQGPSKPLFDIYDDEQAAVQSF